MIAEVERVPCSILNLEFFDRLFDESKLITRGKSGDIIQCLEDQYGDYLVADKLRTVSTSS